MCQVSILVPIFNVEKYIERCAISLFEQTYKEIEYIFVDDCSPDDSVKILEKIIERYPQRREHIRIIHHKKNRGLAAARKEDCEITKQLAQTCSIKQDKYLISKFLKHSYAFKKFVYKTQCCYSIR